MNKKLLIIIIIAVAVIAIGLSLYFFVFAASPPPNEYTYYEPGGYFVTNIKDSNALIKTTIVLELYAPKKEFEDITAYLTENNAIIRDIIVFTLRSKTEEELRAQDIDAVLRKEIVQRISDEMGIDYISTVYFNDYVIQ